MNVDIDEKVCKATISKLRELKDTTSSIVKYDLNTVFLESSGETVDAMKEVMQELYTLGDNISVRIGAIADYLDSYVDAHMEIEEATTNSIKDNIAK